MIAAWRIQAAVALWLVCLGVVNITGCGSATGGARPGGNDGAVGGWQEGVTGVQCIPGSGGASAPPGGWGGGPGGAGGGTEDSGTVPAATTPPTAEHLFQAPPFETPSVYLTGDHPRDVSNGDLNGDGAPDVVGLSDNPCGSITVMLNDGNGHLATPVYYAAGTRPRSVRLGDLNGDSQLDVAVADFEGGGVHVLFGDGSGRLGYPITYSTGPHAISLAVGDVNGDRALDMVVANSENSTVSVLLNGGAGTFSDPVNYPAGEFPHFVELGDVNKDGRLDVVAVQDRVVNVLLNKGGGSFAAGIGYSINTADNAVDLVLGMAMDDIDGNGRADVVVANRGRHEVVVFLSEQDGRLAAPARYAVREAEEVDIADLDGDGRLDLTVGGSSVTVLAGVGDGTFVPKATYAVGAHSVALADLNGDGFPDVTAANGLLNRWIVLWNNGDGTLAD